MNERRDFDEGEELLLIRRFGGGLLRFARHLFTPPDGDRTPRPWFDLSAKKDAAAPRTRVTIKPRELRALADVLRAAADRLEAEGLDLGPAGSAKSARAPEQHRTESARDHLASQPKTGARRG